jgi:ribosomal-protein-alanine N-acetyltransferase
MRTEGTIETSRLVLSRPTLADVPEIFERYASDADVVRYLSFPRHETIAATLAFLKMSDQEWAAWPAGAYLIRSRETGTLLGGTGMSFETPWRAMTGYVLARDSWGQGYATEALDAMVTLARRLHVIRLYALCHPAHGASQRVLDKCGFIKEGTWQQHSVFPNIAPEQPVDTDCFTKLMSG